MFPALNVSLAIKQLDEVVVAVIGHLELVLAELEIQLLAHLTNVDQSELSIKCIDQSELSIY